VLARLAASLFWMARYLERAEHTARLLDVNYHAIIEAPLAAGGRRIVAEQWAPLLRITGSESAFREHFERADGASVVQWLTLHPENPGSIRASLTFARENARALRDRISTETWEAINRSYHGLASGSATVPGDDNLHDYCEAVREANHLVMGIIDATLPRDLGWHLLRAGRSLERADNVIRTLMGRNRRPDDGPVADGLEAHRMMALLKSMSAYEAFRKRHRSAPEPRAVAHYLLLDPDFPRSLRYALTELHDAVSTLARFGPSRKEAQQLERQIGWLAAQVAYCPDVDAILDAGEPSLETLLAEVASGASGIALTYFGG
jgi:uncharacterized alpha-E superfamily protein